MFSRLTSVRHIWDDFVWKSKCPPSLSVLCKPAAVLLLSNWRHVSISMFYPRVLFLCGGQKPQTITWQWWFCFRLSFPDKVRKAIHPFHLCLTLKLNMRVSVLGSWGPKFCSLWLSGGADLITSASCRVRVYARFFFRVRQFQESKLHIGLLFSEIIQFVAWKERQVKIRMKWHVTDDIPLLTLLQLLHCSVGESSHLK